MFPKENMHFWDNGGNVSILLKSKFSGMLNVSTTLEGDTMLKGIV